MMNQYYDSNVCQNVTAVGEQTLTIPTGCQFLANSTLSTSKQTVFLFHQCKGGANFFLLFLASTRNSCVKVNGGSSSSDALSTGEIAGIVVGGVAFAAIAGAVVATTVFGGSLWPSSAAAGQAADGTVTPKGSMDRGSELSSPVISYQNSYGSKSPLTPTNNPLQSTQS